MTWLYGPAAETAAAAEQASRGHALHIRRGAVSGEDLEIGVVTDLTEAWSPLAECELRAEQLWTPQLDKALADLAAAREETAARAAQQAADEVRREASRAATRRRDGAGPESGSVDPTPDSTGSDDRFGTLAWLEELYPALAGWVPEQGWAWTDGLTAEGKAIARVISYIVSRLYASGPISMLLLPDAAKGAEAVAALERAGFMLLYERGGVERWERV